MARIATLLTFLALAVTLLSGWLVRDTHSQWLFAALMLATAALQLGQHRLAPWARRLGGALLVALIALLLATYIVPRSWMSLDDWHRVFTHLPYAQPFYVQRPPVLVLLALGATALGATLAARHAHNRLIVVAFGAALMIAHLLLAPGIIDFHSAVPTGFKAALALLIAAQACMLPSALWRYRRLLVMPLAVGMAVLVGALFAWHYQNQQNLRSIVDLTRDMGDDVAERLGQTLHAQHQAMWSFASFWGLFNRVPSHREWERQAKALLENFGYLQSVAYVAPDGRIARIYPSAGNAALIGRNLAELSGGEALHQTLSYGEESATALIDLKPDERGVIYFMPILSLQRGRIPGAIAYAVRPEALLETQRGYVSTRYMELSASEHGRTFFRARPSAPLSGMKYCNLIALGADTLTACVRPALSRLYAERSFLPDVTLAVGLAFAYLLYCITYFFLRLQRQHLQARETNRDLREEVAKRIALQQEVEWLARHDELTQLPNRRYFMERVHAYQEQLPLAVMIIDIDYFKAINDRLGHQQGDHYLQEVARAARAPVEAQMGILARYGGEEFIACLPRCTLEQAHAVAERVRRAVIAQRLPQPATGAYVTISMGIAVRHDPHHDLAALVLEADQALYCAKHNGRNRIEIALNTESG